MWRTCNRPSFHCTMLQPRRQRHPPDSPVRCDQLCHSYSIRGRPPAGRGSHARDDLSLRSCSTRGCRPARRRRSDSRAGCDQAHRSYSTLTQPQTDNNSLKPKDIGQLVSRFLLALQHNWAIQVSLTPENTGHETNE